MEYFYKIMHIPLAIIDLKGDILIQSQWQRSCTDFHRANSESCKRCIASDTELGNKLEDGENFTSYKCKNGLIDCASPIIIDDKHVANFFIGQFLVNEPDMEYFKAQAKLFGYDEEDYLSSIKDITVVKEDMLEHILGFLVRITDLITSSSLEKSKAQKNHAETKVQAKELEKGQMAALNLAEDAELARLEIENYKKHLESLVEERTGELNEQKVFVQTLLDSQEQIIVTTDGEKMTTANKTFFHFYSVDSIEEFNEKYDSKCICETFNILSPEGYLQIAMDDEKWIDYIIDRSGLDFTHKAMITKDGFNYIFSVTAANLPGNKGLKSAVFTDITAIELAKQEVEAIHKHTRESIDYAALIQGAIVPDNNNFNNYFADFFTIWHPKDTVGGDIYLFEGFRDENECLLMVIDCTGHGVPGAFVTMLVKAIERQVIAKIEHDRYRDIEISPAWILSYFNKNMKKLLAQESEDSISNAGFDGGIIYYNKKEKIVKFAGAETALYYIEDEKLNTIKGSRQSIGYKKSDANFEFKEHIISVKEGMKFYCTTDGYIDQNGGAKSFPFGKRKFSKIIHDNQHESFSHQEELLLGSLAEYQGDEIRNDDVTVIGFEIKEHEILQTILIYDGVLTQGIISHSMDVIQNTVENMSMVGKLSTLVIELTQNMMHYSKSHDLNCRDIRPAGLIEVIKDTKDIYYVRSRNIVSIEDKTKMESALLEVKSLDVAGIKKRYRELRKSGANTHEKGGGIGFYEIAKLIQSFEYSFTQINEEKYVYEFKAVLASRRSKSD